MIYIYRHMRFSASISWYRACKISWTASIYLFLLILMPLQWSHNGYDGVSNHQPYDCLLNRLFRRWSKKTSKLHVTGLCVGNSPVTGEFPAQMASNAEHVSIWWRHHALAPPWVAVSDTGLPLPCGQASGCAIGIGRARSCEMVGEKNKHEGRYLSHTH